MQRKEDHILPRQRRGGASVRRLQGHRIRGVTGMKNRESAYIDRFVVIDGDQYIFGRSGDCPFNVEDNCGHPKNPKTYCLGIAPDSPCPARLMKIKEGS